MSVKLPEKFEFFRSQFEKLFQSEGVKLEDLILEAFSIRNGMEEVIQDCQKKLSLCDINSEDFKVEKHILE